MKTVLIIINLITCSLFIASCSDNELLSTPGEIEQDNQYLIFGTYYGFFVGESINTYKLTKNALYEDMSDNWDISKAQFTRLSDEKFNLVKNLMDSIPSELIFLDDSVFGCPNCSDQGGINIEYNKNGIVKRWGIDQYNGRNPEFLHEFRDLINEKVQLLNP